MRRRKNCDGDFGRYARRKELSESFSIFSVCWRYAVAFSVWFFCKWEISHFKIWPKKCQKNLVYECLGRKKSQLALSEIRPEVAEKWEGSESYHRRNHAQIVVHSVRNSQKFF